MFSVFLFFWLVLANHLNTELFNSMPKCVSKSRKLKHQTSEHQTVMICFYLFFIFSAPWALSWRRRNCRIKNGGHPAVPSDPKSFRSFSKSWCSAPQSYGFTVVFPVCGSKKPRFQFQFPNFWLLQGDTVKTVFGSKNRHTDSWLRLSWRNATSRSTDRLASCGYHWDLLGLIEQAKVHICQQFMTRTFGEQ